VAVGGGGPGQLAGPEVPALPAGQALSELDPARSQALVAELPAGQSILTTAVPLPPGISVARIVHIDDVVGAP